MTGLAAITLALISSNAGLAGSELPQALDEPASEAERAIVGTVLDGCENASRSRIDPFEVLALLRLEKALGVPAEARGLLPAWRCLESSFAPAGSLYGDQGRALGPMQLHQNWLAVLVLGRPGRSSRDWYTAATFGGRDWRTDLEASARTVIQAIGRQLAATSKRCGSVAAWRVAEAIVARPVHEMDCRAETGHWRLARQWRERGQSGL